MEEVQQRNEHIINEPRRREERYNKKRERESSLSPTVQDPGSTVPRGNSARVGLRSIDEQTGDQGNLKIWPSTRRQRHNNAELKSSPINSRRRGYDHKSSHEAAKTSRSNKEEGFVFR